MNCQEKLLCQILAVPPKQVAFKVWKPPITISQRKCVLKYLPRMSDHLICKIEIILHLFDLRRQTRIKFSLLKILQFISILTIFCMQYQSISPWISSALAIISCVVLGWLSWCQHQNIAFLNRTLVELCQKLPSSNIDEQSLHED